LTFISTFIFIILMGLYIYLAFYNKRTLTVTAKFIRQANELNPTIFKSIKLCYSTTSGLRTQISPNNYCDIYLFDNCLAIIRRQEFIFKVFFTPVLLTSDIATTKNKFDYLDTFKPDSITIKKIVKGEVDIKLANPIHKHYTIDMTLKGLTDEQINQLKKIKTGADN